MRPRTRLASLVVALLCLVALPAAASANSALFIQDGGGGNVYNFVYSATAVNNDVTITASATDFQLADTGENITIDQSGLVTPIACTGNGTGSIDCDGVPSVITISLAAGNDTLNWGAGSFPVPTNITGGASTTTNVLNGSPGDDTFNQESSAQDDTITGGAGTDSVNYSSRSAAITVTLQSGANNDGASGEGDTLGSGIENVAGAGSQPNNLTGDGGNNNLTGGSNNDTLTGGDGNDVLTGNSQGTDVVSGGNHNDTVTCSATAGSSCSGGASDDTMNGGGTIDAGTGNDVVTVNGIGLVPVDLGDGNDIVFLGSSQRELVSGGPGTDTVDYSTSSGVKATLDTLANDGQGSEKDNVDVDGQVENLTGSSQADTLTGDTGPNVIKGGDGNDTLNGDAGDDTLDGGLGSDVMNGGAGLADKVSYVTRTVPVEVSLDNLPSNDGAAFEGDTVGLTGDVEGAEGGQANDTLLGDNDDNQLTGGSGEDFISGSGGTDTINGGHNNDSIDGGSGGDTINANNGEDFVDGGPNNDTINAGAGGDFIDGGSGIDTILGGTGSDQIRTKESPAATDNNTDCGDGYDVLVRDAADPNTNCEDVLAAGSTREGTRDDAGPVAGPLDAGAPATVLLDPPASEPEVVSCKVRRTKRAVRIVCTGAAGPVASARLVRNGRVVAVGKRSGGKVRLTAKRRTLRRGRYTLVVGKGTLKARLRASVG